MVEEATPRQAHNWENCSLKNIQQPMPPGATNKANLTPRFLYHLNNQWPVNAGFFSKASSSSHKSCGFRNIYKFVEMKIAQFCIMLLCKHKLYWAIVYTLVKN